MERVFEIGPNFRNEGLDETVLASGAATDGFDYVESTTRPGYNFTNTAFAALVLDSTMELTNGGAGWVVGQNIGSVRVRFSTEWQHDILYHAAPGDILHLLLRLELQHVRIQAERMHVVQDAPARGRVCRDLRHGRGLPRRSR